MSGYPTYELNATQLQLPIFNATFFDEIGDDPFPFEPEGTFIGPLTKWLHQFDGPKWVRPEQNDPDGKRLIKERMVRSPDWLFSRWPEVGIHGGWGMEPPRGVLGHAIVILGRVGGAW